eukprot:2170518-Pyramimonas_sp.AAC.1
MSVWSPSELQLIGLDTDTVELAVKTLSSHLLTRQFNSPVSSLRKSGRTSAWIRQAMRGGCS